MSAAAATRQASAPRGWTHHIPDSFFRSDLEPNLERLVLRLEGLARDKPWCFTSNDELMDTPRVLAQHPRRKILNRGEQRGWFRRVLVPGRHGRATGRLGIVLFIRPTDRPVATPETFDQVVDLMRAEIRRGRPGRPAQDPPLPRSDSPESAGRRHPGIWGPRSPKIGHRRSPKIGHRPLIRREITEKETETTTTLMHGAPASADVHALPESSSSVLDPGPEGGPGIPASRLPGEDTAPRDPRGRCIHASGRPLPCPDRDPAGPRRVPPAAAGLPAELVAAAAEAIPGASREWVQGLLRGCGGYGLGPGVAGGGMGEGPSAGQAGPVCPGRRCRVG